LEGDTPKINQTRLAADTIRKIEHYCSWEMHRRQSPDIQHYKSAEARSTFAGKIGGVASKTWSKLGWFGE
jgi:hypothetical protein